MHKYFIGWIILIAVSFIGAGTLMAVQGFQAQKDVKANVAAEKIALGVAEKADGTRDEAVAEFVPAVYQGKPLAEAKLPDALLWQREIIREHTLTSTKGLTFAEMPRTIPKLDEAGNQIIGEDGKPIMVLNTARDIWITATTLTTALNLGIMSYAFSALIIFIGLVTIWFGTLFRVLVRKH